MTNLIVTKIIEVFETFRMSPLVIDQFQEKGKLVLYNKIEPFVLRNEPIKFSILGFPMKSPNSRDKVIGKIPDLAENLTIDNFKEFNRAVSAVYSPGVLLAIISDGFAFNDIMEVSDKTVLDYQYRTMEMIGKEPIKWFNIYDFYSKDLSLNTIREKLTSQFGISAVELEKRILLDNDVNMLYKGMIRFMNLDLAIKDFNSNTQLQKQAKIIAKEMMFRNEAYSALIRQEFSDHIRLSMHPSVNDGTKFSFQLIRSAGNIFTSAWHCAIAIVDGVVETIHKRDAETRGMELVFSNGIPTHYQK